jgi:hypothetical protein
MNYEINNPKRKHIKYHFNKLVKITKNKIVDENENKNNPMVFQVTTLNLKKHNFQIVSVEFLIKYLKIISFTYIHMHLLQMQKPLIYLLELIFIFSCPFHLISYFMLFYTLHN